MRPSHKEVMETGLTPTTGGEAMTSIMTGTGQTADKETNGRGKDQDTCRGSIMTVITAAIAAATIAGIAGTEDMTGTSMTTAGTTEEIMTGITGEDTEAGN